MTNEAQKLFTKFAKANRIDYDELWEKQSFQNFDCLGDRYRHQFADGSAIVRDYGRECMNLGIHMKNLQTEVVKIACANSAISPKFAMPKLVGGLSEEMHS